MKKILLFVLVASTAYVSKLQAQCSVASPGVTIHSTKDTTVGSQSSCVVVFDLNFKLQYNGGNKIVVIQSWLDADYPNYWNCDGSHAPGSNANAPKASDLKLNGTGPLPFFDFVFKGIISAPMH